MSKLSILIGVFVSVPAITHLTVTAGPPGWGHSRYARKIGIAVLGLSLIGGFLLPSLFSDRLVTPSNVAIMVVGGSLALAAATFLILDAVSTATWVRSFKARRIAFGIFASGLVLVVVLPPFLN